MEYIISEIKKCLDAGAWYAALTLVLTLPAICAAAENPKDKNQRRGKDHSKYLSWIESTALPKKYGNNIGEQLYGLRCSVLHEGTFWVGTENMPRLIVVPPNDKLGLHNVTFTHPQGCAVAHDVPSLCEDIIEEVRIWENKNHSNKTVQKNIQEVTRVHLEGIPPFVAGIPVIG